MEGWGIRCTIPGVKCANRGDCPRGILLTQSTAGLEAWVPKYPMVPGWLVESGGFLPSKTQEADSPFGKQGRLPKLSPPPPSALGIFRWTQGIKSAPYPPCILLLSLTRALTLKTWQQARIVQHGFVFRRGERRSGGICTQRASGRRSLRAADLEGGHVHPFETAEMGDETRRRAGRVHV